MFDTRSRIACLTLAGTLLAGSRVASAQQESQSDCPRLAEVRARLDQLLVSGATDAPEAIEIRDHGASWEIEVAGHGASYPDPVRDCAERTRVATVFAALALEPPTEPEMPAVSRPAEAPSPVQASAHQSVELAPALVMGVRAGDTATAFAGSLRWQISGLRLGLVAGVAAMLPAVVRAGAYQAELTRVVFDLSPRLWLRAGSAAFTLEMGPFAGLLSAKGRNLSPGGSSTSLDAGARLAVRVELRRRRLSPFLAAQGELSARGFRMLVEPSGDVGNTPRLWLGLLLGAALGL